MKVGLGRLFSRNLGNSLRARLLANHGVGIVTTTRNGTLVVDPQDRVISAHLLSQGEYVWPEITQLSRLVGASSRLVFVGAHIGALLVPIVRASGTRSVIAFEPSPRNHQMLLMNLALNELAGVVAENIAVGARPGKLRFTGNRIISANLSRVAPKEGDTDVTVHTLDATIPRAWESIELIVMSAPGREADVLRGASRTLLRTQRLYVELASPQRFSDGNTIEDFAGLASIHFRSAYVLGEKPRFIPPAQFSPFLRGLTLRGGERAKLLLSRENTPAPELAPAL